MKIMFSRNITMQKFILSWVEVRKRNQKKETRTQSGSRFLIH
jgi:hypothetical protein